jgi:hypothetical protein
VSETSSPKNNVASGLTSNKLAQAAVGAIMLLAAGLAGGKVVGFRVEPEGCAECRENLAACEARDDLIIEALNKAETALMQAQSECAP